MKNRQRLALSKPQAIVSADSKTGVEGVRSSRHSTRRQDHEDVTATATSACMSTSSPARHLHAAKTDEDILWSPQHLKMNLRQEDLYSQTLNSQEILWDYTSPDAIRQLKRIRKCRNGDNMSDIVLRFLDDKCEITTTTPPLLSLWMEANMVDVTSKTVRAPTIAHPIKKSSRRRRPTAARNNEETKALIQGMIQRCEANEESSSEVGNHDVQKKESVEKLQSCKKDSPNTSKCIKNADSKSTTEQLKTVCLDKSTDSDLWTDDDELLENSFILEATQLPAGKRKYSPAREQPSVKNKRYTFSLTADTNVIPPTFASSNSARSVINTSQNNCKNIYQTTNNQYMTNMSRADCATNSNSFKKHSSFDDKSTYVMSKSPWRRCNSFSGSRSPVNATRRQASCTVSRLDSEHKDINTEINNNRCNLPIATKCVQDSFKPKVPKVCDNRFQSFVRNESRSASSVLNKNNLDTSISDELLFQLAEPDELLESQLTPEGAAQKICSELGQDGLFDDDMDLVSIVNTNLTNTTSVSIKKSGGKEHCLKYKGQSSYCDVSASNCIAPTQKLAEGKFVFKNTGFKSKEVSVTNCGPLQSCVNRNAVSDMKKTLQKEESTVSKCTGYELGGKQELDDDSFLGDDALFESQILAMLDEVESQASQKTTTHVSPVRSNKCTSKEIERKRLAALEKKKKNHPL